MTKTISTGLTADGFLELYELVCDELLRHTEDTDELTLEGSICILTKFPRSGKYIGISNMRAHAQKYRGLCKPWKLMDLKCVMENEETMLAFKFEPVTILERLVHG